MAFKRPSGKYGAAVLMLLALPVPGAPPRVRVSFSAGRPEGPVTLTGRHRFLRIAGRTGYHPLSLKTKAEIATGAHTGERGSIVLWVAPLESLGVASTMQAFAAREPDAQQYGLVADAFPLTSEAHAVFAFHWRSTWHPQMVAKIKRGTVPGLATLLTGNAFAVVEHLPLEKGQWYQLAFTWDKPAHRLAVYVNGILAGANFFPFEADRPNPVLYFGNPSMAFGELEIYDSVLAPRELAASARAAAPPARIQNTLLDLFTVRPRPAAAWTPDKGWNLDYSATFTREADLDGWIQEGCTGEPYRMVERRITPEGLLLETPGVAAVEARMYLWSPRSFEGDIAVEHEFRPEKDTGLSLLVVHASGMRREDFLRDHPLHNTGSMATIIASNVRNYHWEYFRRVGNVRADLATQVLVKNPWQRPLGMSAREPYRVGEWYRLLYLQEGSRIRAAIDGVWLLDATDDAFQNTGPVFNSGRIGLRLMFETRMRFRNLKVWTRRQGVEEIRRVEQPPGVSAGPGTRRRRFPLRGAGPA